FPGFVRLCVAHFSTTSDDGEAIQINLTEVDPRLREILRVVTTKGRRNTEIWRLESEVLGGASYRYGDYLIVDLAKRPKARDMVIIMDAAVSYARMYFPPYGVGVPLPGAQPLDPITVDNVRTVVRGVITRRFAT